MIRVGIISYLTNDYKGELRRTYLDAVISDIQVMIAEDGLKFAQQDLEIAYILAFPDDIALLDSLDAVIKTRLNE